MPRKTISIAVLLLLVPLLVIAQERVDLNVMHKIKADEFGANSKVMDIVYNLTDRYGPRLTNSPQYRAAGDWAAGQLKEWGLSNVHLEKWATPANNPIPGWQCTYFSANMVEPTFQPLIGVPQAWTAGTNGPVTGEAVLAQVQTPADMDKFRGKLKGKIVLLVPAVELPFPMAPLARRYTDEQLAELVPDIIPGAGRGGRGGPGGPGGRGAPNQPQMAGVGSSVEQP